VLNQLELPQASIARLALLYIRQTYLQTNLAAVIGVVEKLIELLNKQVE
jgi:hypothetical protein